MNKNKKVYIMYKYNQLVNDLVYFKEFYSLEEIAEQFNLKNKRSIHHYITNNIDNIKELLNNKYLIIKEEITKEEYQEILEGVR